MFALTNLVRNEFFPKELPPCFTTSKVTDLLSLEELETLGKTDYNEKESSSITFASCCDDIASARKRLTSFWRFVMYFPS